jgi:hypothetical protein
MQALMSDPLVIPASQLPNITGAIRAVVDDMIVQGLIVIDRSFTESVQTDD